MLAPVTAQVVAVGKVTKPVADKVSSMLSHRYFTEGIFLTSMGFSLGVAVVAVQKFLSF